MLAGRWRGPGGVGVMVMMMGRRLRMMRVPVRRRRRRKVRRSVPVRRPARMMVMRPVRLRGRSSPHFARQRPRRSGPLRMRLRLPPLPGPELRLEVGGDGDFGRREVDVGVAGSTAATSGARDLGILGRGRRVHCIRSGALRPARRRRHRGGRAPPLFFGRLLAPVLSLLLFLRLFLRRGGCHGVLVARRRRHDVRGGPVLELPLDARRRGGRDLGLHGWRGR
mmetsp:Transcript_45464/g.84194  ORF Transcript_45464/g.84194 Transcript_45464/m.84194 type:complete len:223 (-) Transcript_45464:1194-1862(-)